MPRSNGRASIKAVSPKPVSRTPLAPAFEAQPIIAMPNVLPSAQTYRGDRNEQNHQRDRRLRCDGHGAYRSRADAVSEQARTPADPVSDRRPDRLRCAGLSAGALAGAWPGVFGREHGRIARSE